MSAPDSQEEAVFSVHDLKVYFKLRGNVSLRAIDGVSLTIERSHSLGVVGESGSGKTTLGKALLRIQRPTSGTIEFEGKDISKLKGIELQEFRRKVQMVFQDPFDAIDPIFSVYDVVSEGIRILKICKTRAEEEKVVFDALDRVQLTPPQDFVNRRITSLSGGQRQRVALARSLAMSPTILVLDEPVSMLDASVRGEVIQLMEDMKKLGWTFVMITHDIATVRFFTDKIAVMYLGKLVETGDTQDVITEPLHPYTKALIAAVPVPDPTYLVKNLAKGEIPNAASPPSGCHFHPRCPMAQKICQEEEPLLREVRKGRFAACHFA
ncbi:MAG TPA: ABC transporter ATP-binding protein [Nitrososphaerales archaeon]|nr:ABC transporter ATP-binding protein [Nitrososphaerales archaeon]